MTWHDKMLFSTLFYIQYLCRVVFRQFAQNIYFMVELFSRYWLLAPNILFWYRHSLLVCLSKSYSQKQADSNILIYNRFSQSDICELAVSICEFLKSHALGCQFSSNGQLLRIGCFSVLTKGKGTFQTLSILQHNSLEEMADSSSSPSLLLEPSSTAQNSTLVLLYSLELLFHLIELPISSLNFYIIFQSAILHPNLKFVLLCQSYSIFQRSFGRLLVDCVKFWRQEMVWDGSDILQYIYRSAIFFCNFLGHVLVLERAMATVWVKDYEHRRRRWFSAIWFSAVLSTTVYNLYSRSAVEEDPNELVTSIANLLTTFAILAMALGEIFLFCWLLFYNHRIYRRRFRAETEHSLTERYQLSENIRTGRQLFPTFCFHFMNIVATSIIQSVFFYRPFQGQFAYNLTIALIVLWGTLNNLGIEITTIIFHPFLARRLKQIVANLIHIGRNRVQDESCSSASANKFTLAIDINGTNLVSNQDQMDTYFSMLEKAWKK